MKLRAAFYFFICFISLTFSQNTENNTGNSFVDKVVRERIDNYYALDSLLYNNNANRNTLTEDNYYKLYQRSIKNKYIIGQIYAANSIGRILRRKSNYLESIKYHKEALVLAKKLKDIDTQIITLNLLGVAYRRQDDVRNALNYHQSALSLARKIKNKTLEHKKSISISQNSIGNIYLTLHQYDLALEKFEESIYLQKQVQNKRGLAINYQNMGYAQESLMMLDDAIENYNKSLEINNEIDSKIGKVICKNSLASAYIKKGNYKKALNTMQLVYPLAKESGNKYYIARTLSHLGWAFLKNEDFTEAEKHLTEAYKISKEFGFKKSEINSSFHLAELYENIDDKPKAYEFYKSAVDLEKNTLGQQNISYVNNLISKHDLQAKINEINNLESQSRIKTLQFSKNKNILIITLITIALLSIALYSIYRQRLLNNDKKILVLEQQALQTQMNPHFIFNALNSIKLYIINNEQKQAVYYLNKFSKLIRNILDVSKVKEVSLRDELSTMELYMSIENIRFSNEIDYKVDINPDLNTDTIKVPPLILQPFIENAIWHGLSSKESDKQIMLTATKNSNKIVEINIIDNGIGRPAADKIKKGKSLKRKSVGIDLTKERLKTFSEDYDTEYSLEYHDLKKEDGSSAGTKVSIKLPLP